MSSPRKLIATQRKGTYIPYRTAKIVVGVACTMTMREVVARNPTMWEVVACVAGRGQAGDACACRGRSGGVPGGLGRAE